MKNAGIKKIPLPAIENKGPTVLISSGMKFHLNY
jgi:hypothetical protein